MEMAAWLARNLDEYIFSCQKPARTGRTEIASTKI
jgi:hypothetical protein